MKTEQASQAHGVCWQAARGGSRANALTACAYRAALRAGRSWHDTAARRQLGRWAMVAGSERAGQGRLPRALPRRGKARGNLSELACKLTQAHKPPPTPARAQPSCKRGRPHTPVLPAKTGAAECRHSSAQAQPIASSVKTEGMCLLFVLAHRLTLSVFESFRRARRPC